MTFRILIHFILVCGCLKGNSQINSDSAYKYQYRFAQLDGLKDKSELIIQKAKTTNPNKFNVTGTVLRIREIYTDSTYSIKTDSVEIVPDYVRLRLLNRTDTIEEYLDNKFEINVPSGKYNLSISRVGMGFINRKIRIKENEIYVLTFYLKTRRVIHSSIYRCKTELSNKEFKTIRKYYKSPESYHLPEPDCDCQIEQTIYE